MTASGAFLRDGLGCWAEMRAPTPAALAGKAALFLDRDGVVVEEKNYLGRAQDMRLIAGAASAIAAAKAAGFATVVVTNQSGIGRGYYDWNDFRSVQDAMHEALARDGASIDLVYACAYHKKGRTDFAIEHHDWRKPNTGMIRAAADDAAIDLRRSIIVGDRATDLEAGRLAGLCGGILVETGYGGSGAEWQAARALEEPSFRVSRVANLAEAVPMALQWAAF